MKYMICLLALIGFSSCHKACVDQDCNVVDCSCGESCQCSDRCPCKQKLNT